MDRLTYKTSMGDYGGTKTFENEYEEICALRNKLGKYEDLNVSAETIKKLLVIIEELFKQTKKE